MKGATCGISDNPFPAPVRRPADPRCNPASQFRQFRAEKGKIRLRMIEWYN
jgi:hypothetical protein